MQNPHHKMLLVLGVLYLCISTRAQSIQYEDGQAPILKYENHINPDGSYKFSYETGNRISVSESGDHKGGALESSGQYSYVAPDGQRVFTYWEAGEGGFRPRKEEPASITPTPATAVRPTNSTVEIGLFGYVRPRG